MSEPHEASCWQVQCLVVPMVLTRAQHAGQNLGGAGMCTALRPLALPAQPHAHCHLRTLRQGSLHPSLLLLLCSALDLKCYCPCIPVATAPSSARLPLSEMSTWGSMGESAQAVCQQRTCSMQLVPMSNSCTQSELAQQGRRVPELQPRWWPCYRCTRAHRGYAPHAACDAAAAPSLRGTQSRL